MGCFTFIKVMMILFNLAIFVSAAQLLSVPGGSEPGSLPRLPREAALKGWGLRERLLRSGPAAAGTGGRSLPAWALLRLRVPARGDGEAGVGVDGTHAPGTPPAARPGPRSQAEDSAVQESLALQLWSKPRGLCWDCCISHLCASRAGAGWRQPMELPSLGAPEQLELGAAWLLPWLEELMMVASVQAGCVLPLWGQGGGGPWCC